MVGDGSRAHREILHLAQLLERLNEHLASEEIDRYLIRDDAVSAS
jgi:hypothetical protein